jgi:AcrR family transcriptional regulator
MIIVENKRTRGRPRAFDEEAALGDAMRVFWAEGYEATTIPMLTEAMGISAQSLYAAFGSKEALYRKALEIYVVTIGGFAARALEEEADAIVAVQRLLRDAARTFSHSKLTPGCMITTSPADIADTPLTLMGRELRARGIIAVAARLHRGINEQQLPVGFPCQEWARYIGSVVQGMSVQARDGATVEALLAIAEIAASSLGTHRASEVDFKDKGKSGRMSASSMPVVPLAIDRTIHKI